MKLSKLNNLLRVLFVLFSVLFLLTACGAEQDGAIAIDQGDPRKAAELQNTCWQRKFLEYFYKNIGTQTKTVYTNLTSENLLNVVLLGFTIWMAYQILRHISTPTPESLGEFWTKIIRKAFLCAFCGILASSTSQIYYLINNFIFPIYITILEFTSEIMERLAKDPDAMVKTISIKSTFSDDATTGAYICEVYPDNWGATGCKYAQKSGDTFSESNFPSAPLDMLGCMACAVSDRLSIGYDIGIRLMKLVSLTSFICGGFLIVCFTIAKLCFVLYLVDSIFRLNMILIILPFLIMAYPFEQIRKWSIKGFQIILSSSAIMLCLGIIVSTTILAMQKMLVQEDIGFGNQELYENFGTTALSLIFMGFMIVKATGLAVDLSGRIVGYKGSTGFQKKVQQLVAMIAKGAFHIITVGGGKVATTIIDHIERLREIREKYRQAKAKMQEMRDKMNRYAGRQTGGKK